MKYERGRTITEQEELSAIGRGGQDSGGNTGERRLTLEDFKMPHGNLLLWKLPKIHT